MVRVGFESSVRVRPAMSSRSSSHFNQSMEIKLYVQMKREGLVLYALERLMEMIYLQNGIALEYL